MNNQQEDFEKQATQKRRGIVEEFWGYLQDNKKWWLLPFIVMVLILGTVAVLSGTAAGPFIYALF